MVKYSLDELKKLGYHVGPDGVAKKVEGTKVPKKKLSKTPNKHGAIKVEYEGKVFDSKKELARYKQLLVMQQSGYITNLRMQVSYPLKVREWIVNDVKVDLGYWYMREYIADFVYEIDGLTIVEDVKSKHTKNMRPYKIKKKLLKAIYDIEIKET